MYSEESMIPLPRPTTWVLMASCWDLRDPALLPAWLMASEHSLNLELSTKPNAATVGDVMGSNLPLAVDTGIGAQIREADRPRIANGVLEELELLVGDGSNELSTQPASLGYKVSFQIAMVQAGNKTASTDAAAPLISSGPRVSMAVSKPITPTIWGCVDNISNDPPPPVGPWVDYHEYAPGIVALVGRYVTRQKNFGNPSTAREQELSSDREAGEDLSARGRWLPRYSISH
ncbi:uncharacterized protein PG986_010978 [Apiospora aurea]|uniref:Uncharacterized protein n=1 Tax=Apiospora aurea TaxID=335848 RepID=A0ABR1Q3Z1_9PEZI